MHVKKIDIDTKINTPKYIKLDITMEKMLKFGRVFAIAASLPLKCPLQKLHCEGQQSPTLFLHHQRDWNTFASPRELAQQAKD